MNKQFRIDFFRVAMPLACGTTFNATVDSVLAKPIGPERNHAVNNCPIRIQLGTTTPDFCEGDLIRIQMDELPLKAGLDGSAVPVDFKDDEGLGHESAFLYYIPLQILLLQRNKSGVSPEAVSRYIEAHGGFDGPVHLEPVPMPDAIGRLNKMEKVRKFNVRVSALARAKQFETDNPSVQKMLGLINDMSSMVLSIELNAGLKRKDSIDKGGVVNTIRGLLGLPADVAGVERIDVSGRDQEDAKMDTLHLLDFCMTEKAVVKSSGRRIPYSIRATSIMQAWKNRRETLQKMFGQPTV